MTSRTRKIAAPRPATQIGPFVSPTAAEKAASRNAFEAPMPGTGPAFGKASGVSTLTPAAFAASSTVAPDPIAERAEARASSSCFFPTRSAFTRAFTSAKVAGPAGFTSTGFTIASPRAVATGSETSPSGRSNRSCMKAWFGPMPAVRRST